MSRSALRQAWLILVGLTAMTSIVATCTASADPSDNATMVAGPMLLLLALAKTRIILAHYLGLAQVPSVLRGFTVVVLLYVVLLAALYIAPVLI